MRYFVEVMFEGEWNRIDVANTYGEAEELSLQVQDWADGLYVRIIPEAAKRRATSDRP